MEQKLDLYNSINVYTDASTTPFIYGRRSNEFTSSPGYVIVYNNIIRLYGNKFVYRTDAVYGEIYAILMGIKAVYREILNGTLPDNIPINIFSDCLSSIQNLRENIKNWYVLDNILRKTNDDKQIPNQDVYIKIIELVNTYGIPVNFYHIKGHAHITLNKKASLGDKVELKRIQQNFFRMNHTFITEQAAAELCYYNIFVDNFTRSNMKECMRSDTYNNNNYIKPKLKSSQPITKEALRLFSTYTNGG